MTLVPNLREENRAIWEITRMHIKMERKPLRPAANPGANSQPRKMLAARVYGFGKGFGGTPGTTTTGTVE
jgi:hypothetical protein